LTVAELANLFLKWAMTHYVKDGESTSEIGNVKRAIQALCVYFASLPAKEFSPLKLKAVRQRLEDDGLSRVSCNRYTRIVRRIFSFGIENELMPSGIQRNGEIHAILDSLRSVKPLEKGRTKAPEMDPVLPVDDQTVQATLEHLDARSRAMIKIQTLLACRPGELTAMRPRDIDRSEGVWVYRPRSHKTMHKGKSRIIPIGPRAQLLLRPWLPENPDERVFPVTPDAYRNKIFRACDKAGVDVWSPNQLRHVGATRIRQQASLDAAQVILGHSSIATTQVYAEKNVAAAMKIAAEVG
jgi:integrase